MKCECCGKDFEPGEKRGARKYCSRKCCYHARYRRAHPKQAKQKICPMCGAEFEAFYDQKKYCSAKCRNRWNNVLLNNRLEESRQVESPQERNCPQCGKPFKVTTYNKKFCSRKCGRRFNRGCSRKVHIKTCPTFPPPKVEVKPIEPPKVEVKPIEPPKVESPKVIIPVAEAENRKPTVEELLDWIFSKERTA